MKEIRTSLSLRKIVFGSGIGKPMIAPGNSLSGDCRLGHGRDLVIKVRLWAASHSEGTGCGTEQPSTPEPSQLYSHHERLGRTSFVAMMEAVPAQKCIRLAKRAIFDGER
jgi:hypothetical protein